MGLWLICLAVLAAPTVEVSLDPLPGQPLVTQQASATVRLAAAEPTRLQLTWRLTCPGEEVHNAVDAVTAEPGQPLVVHHAYSLIDPGEYQLTLTVSTEGGVELASQSQTVTPVGFDQAPLVFPNYYRQQTTVLAPGNPRTAALVDSAVLSIATDDWGLSEAQRTAPVAVHLRDDRALTLRLPDGELALDPLAERPTGARAPIPVVSVGPDNRLMAQGQPWFPLGLYDMPSSPASMAKLAEAGFDLVTCQPLPPSLLKDYLDHLDAAGLRAWIPLAQQLDFSTGAEAKREQIAKLVEAAGDHPALAIWESLDEPAWNGFSADGLRAGYQYLRQLDPRHPIWTNHAPRNSVPGLAWYNRATDIAGCDVYPVPMPQTQSSLADKTLGVVGAETRKSVASVLGQKPILMVLQAFAWAALTDPDSPTAIYPTAAQSRFMAYDAIVNGANGLQWWGIHATPRPSTFWNQLRGLVSELAGLQPVLAAPTAVAEEAPQVASPDRGVRALRKIWLGHSFVFVVNETDHATAVRLKVPGGETAQWRPLWDDPAPRQVGHEVHLQLPAWGVAAMTTHPTFAAERKLFTEAAGAAPAPLPREAGNLLANPSMEQADSRDSDQVAGWMARIPLLTARDEQVAHGGVASLRLADRDSGTRPLVLQQGLLWEDPGEYELSGWVRSDKPGLKTRIYAEWVRDGAYLGKLLEWTEPGTAWRQVSGRFRVAERDLGPFYVVAQVDGEGQAWFDDLAVARVGP